MDTEIGPFDKSTTSVPVTFKQNDIIFTRDVNACLSEDGSYDVESTANRVSEVARGVAAKIKLGVITPETGAASAPIDEPAPAS